MYLLRRLADKRLGEDVTFLESQLCNRSPRPPLCFDADRYCYFALIKF